MSTPIANPTRQQLDELDALLQRMLSLPLNQLDADLSAPPPPVRPAPPPPVGYSTTPAPIPPPRPLAPPPPRPVVVNPPPRPAPPPMPPRREPTAGDHTWNVPLPSTGGSASVYGNWPMGFDAVSAPPRPVAPPPAPQPPMPPPSNLRVTTIPSPDQNNQAREAPPPMERLRTETPYNPPVESHAVPPSPAAVPVASPQFEPVPVHYWPLAAIDWMIGKPLSMFGVPGQWIGQGSGKILVGWAGILLLAGAAVWGVVDYMGWSW